MVNKYSTGSLPFVYGYGFRYDDITYHLIHAERINQAVKNTKSK